MEKLTEKEKFELIMGQTFRSQTEFVGGLKMIINQSGLLVETGLIPKSTVAEEIMDLATEKLNVMAQQIRDLFELLEMTPDRMNELSEEWEKKLNSKTREILQNNPNVH